MKHAIRNRIVAHVTVRAGDLLPHPLNFRRHPAGQRAALEASYQEVGFARSLLGFRLPDGRIQLIDGHLRRDLDPEMSVTVEVLDVGEEEARKLLLTIDPLAALAETDKDVVAQLQEITRAEFLTRGLRGASGGYPISHFALRTMSVPDGWKLPRKRALAEFSNSYLLFSASAHCTIYRVGRIELPGVTYYGLVVGAKEGLTKGANPVEEIPHG